MKAIQIRNVPDDVHARLQARANTAGQSMQEYLLALLREHAARPTMQEWLAEASTDSGGVTGMSFDDIVRIIHEERPD